MHGKAKVAQGGWIIVCDGRKALILENTGDSKFPNLKTKEVHEQDNPPTHEQGTDQPGRSINSVGSGRSAMEQTDWHEQAERAFLHNLAQRLDVALNNDETKALVIVAPPRALGILRESYSNHLKDAIVDEVSKDYVKMPIHEIEKHLWSESSSAA